MDIKTFFACARALPPHISILVKGDHGIGKSQIVRKLARLLALDMGISPADYEVVDRRLSQMSEGDMIGLPSQDGKTTRFLPMDWFMQCVEKACMLFLDEGNRGSQEVLQASFQIALDLELNGHRLNPKSRVVMAINADETKYQVNPMDPAFIDRWFIVDLQPTKEEWQEWALDHSPEGGCIHKHVTDFMVASQFKFLDPSYNEGPSEKDTSRRSWDRFSQCYTTQKFDQLDLTDQGNLTFLTAFATGFLGQPSAAAFVDFVKAIEKHLTAEDVLNNFDKIGQARLDNLSQGELNGVNNHLTEWMCANTLTDAQAQNFGKWVQFAPAEISCGLWQAIAMHPGQTTVNIKLFHKYVSPYILKGVNAQKAT
jgi:hypothetical protein